MAKNITTKGISIVSPKGALEWCKYLEPDTKYNTDGELSTNLILDPTKKDVQDFITKLEDLRDTALAELKENLGAKGKTWGAVDIGTPQYDEDGEETGNIIVKFKLKDIAKRKASGKAYTVKAAGPNKEVLKVPVGNGSIGVVGAFAFPYENPSQKKVGISMMFQKLKVFDLVALDGSGGDDDIFAVEEDEFETTITISPTTTSSPTTTISPAILDDLDF